MKLSELGIKATVNPILFVGQPEDSGKVSTDGEVYYVWKLKTPIMLRCSTDSAIEPFETDELYLRASALESDKWEGTAEGGLTIPGWVADFSKGQEIGLYQETTIQRWARDNRGVRNLDRTKSINDRIKIRQADRAAKKS